MISFKHLSFGTCQIFREIFSNCVQGTELVPVRLFQTWKKENQGNLNQAGHCQQNGPLCTMFFVCESLSQEQTFESPNCFQVRLPWEKKPWKLLLVQKLLDQMQKCIERRPTRTIGKRWKAANLHLNHIMQSEKCSVWRWFLQMGKWYHLPFWFCAFFFYLKCWLRLRCVCNMAYLRVNSRTHLFINCKTKLLVCVLSWTNILHRQNQGFDVWLAASKKLQMRKVANLYSKNTKFFPLQYLHH